MHIEGMCDEFGFFIIYLIDNIMIYFRRKDKLIVDILRIVINLLFIKKTLKFDMKNVKRR